MVTESYSVLGAAVPEQAVREKAKTISITNTNIFFIILHSSVLLVL